jgi:hypothetical protein
MRLHGSVCGICRLIDGRTVKRHSAHIGNASSEAYRAGGDQDRDAVVEEYWARCHVAKCPAAKLRPPRYDTKRLACWAHVVWAFSEAAGQVQMAISRM